MFRQSASFYDKKHLNSISQCLTYPDLRHSCASLLLSQGIPMKQIQEWLGHSTFATTADIYSHLDFNSKLESADAITAAFAEEKPAEEQEEDDFGMSLSM